MDKWVKSDSEAFSFGIQAIIIITVVTRNVLPSMWIIIIITASIFFWLSVKPPTIRHEVERRRKGEELMRGEDWGWIERKSISSIKKRRRKRQRERRETEKAAMNERVSRVKNDWWILSQGVKEEQRIFRECISYAHTHTRAHRHTSKLVLCAHTQTHITVQGFQWCSTEE